jgi:hypothetical protein
MVDYSGCYLLCLKRLSGIPLYDELMTFCIMLNKAVIKIYTYE